MRLQIIFSSSQLTYSQCFNDHQAVADMLAYSIAAVDRAPHDPSSPSSVQLVKAEECWYLVHMRVRVLPLHLAALDVQLPDDATAGDHIYHHSFQSAAPYLNDPS